MIQVFDDPDPPHILTHTMFNHFWLIAPQENNIFGVAKVVGKGEFQFNNVSPGSYFHKCCELAMRSEMHIKHFWNRLHCLAFFSTFFKILQSFQNGISHNFSSKLFPFLCLQDQMLPLCNSECIWPVEQWIDFLVV